MNDLYFELRDHELRPTWTGFDQPCRDLFPKCIWATGNIFCVESVAGALQSHFGLASNVEDS